MSKKLENNEKLTNNFGSLPYLAPELLHNEPYGLKADVWSAMVALYTIFTGKTPFPATQSLWQLKQDMPTNFDIVSQLYHQPKLRQLSPMGKDFLRLGFTKAQH